MPPLEGSEEGGEDQVPSQEELEEKWRDLQQKEAELERRKKKWTKRMKKKGETRSTGNEEELVKREKKAFNARSMPLNVKLEAHILPLKLTIPRARSYEGRTDPVEHLTHVKQVMTSVNFPEEAWDKCHCRCLSVSLTGAALEWYDALSSRSIDTFTQLADAFIKRFSMHQQPSKKSSDLYAIVQGKGEALEDYIERFNTVRAVIPSLRLLGKDFRKGLPEELRLCRELIRSPDLTFEQIMQEAQKERRWEAELDRRKKVREQNQKDRIGWLKYVKAERID